MLLFSVYVAIIFSLPCPPLGEFFIFFSLNVGLYTFHHLKNIHFVPNLITNSDELCPNQITS